MMENEAKSGLANISSWGPYTALNINSDPHAICVNSTIHIISYHRISILES